MSEHSKLMAASGAAGALYTLATLDWSFTTWLAGLVAVGLLCGIVVGLLEQRPRRHQRG